MRIGNGCITTKWRRKINGKYFVLRIFIGLMVVIMGIHLLMPLYIRKSITKRTLPENFYVVFHLDLKGAPPKLSYLKSLLQKLKLHGVNGLLIEYEDMFPYHGRAKNLSVSHAYKDIELKNFLLSVVRLGIEIIPLVQTFGHMEFALKHEEFSDLSEHPEKRDSICPSKSGSYILIKMMLKQIINFHKKICPIKYIHIGSDEVFHLNECYRCKKRNLKDFELYESHILDVSNIVNRLSPRIQILLWDDMIRGKHNELIPNKPSFMPIEPVVWNYRISDYNEVKPIDLYKYNILFGKMWIASAFKGADGSNATFPVMSKRFINHYSWLSRIVHSWIPHLSDFRGIILTGWSRYDHYSPVCELLPVSVPSLIINLLLVKLFKTKTGLDTSKTWDDFYFTYLHSEVQTTLDCDLKNLFRNEEPLMCGENAELVAVFKILEAKFPNNGSQFKKNFLVSLDELMEILTDLGVRMQKWYSYEVINQYLGEKMKQISNTDVKAILPAHSQPVAQPAWITDSPDQIWHD